MVFRFGQNHQTGVGVHIDEPWADNFQCGVNDPGGLGAGRVSPKDVDRFPFHSNRSIESRVAGAVHDKSVVDQKVKQATPRPDSVSGGSPC